MFYNMSYLDCDIYNITTCHGDSFEHVSLWHLYASLLSVKSFFANIVF
jgi:hypothetical protein